MAKGKLCNLSLELILLKQVLLKRKPLCLSDFKMKLNAFFFLFIIKA